MAVKLRLQRFGKRDASCFRIVAIDESSKRDGKIISQLGTYNPGTKPPLIEYDQAKVENWLKKGAIASDTVRKLLSK